MQSFQGLVAPLLLAAACTASAFDLQAHRGGRGLAPENTLPAFERALAVGVTTLELDIGISADGVPVVAHDPHLHPDIARDAAGHWVAPPRGPLLRTLTFAQLQAYDVGRLRPGSSYAASFPGQHAHDGARIPSLAQVFALAQARGAGRVRFNIETKLHPLQPDETAPPELMVRALLQAVREAGLAQRVTVQSFDWRTLRLVQRLAPGIPTACLTRQFHGSDTTRGGTWTAGLHLEDHGSLPRLARAAGCSIWSPNGAALTPALVQEARALGLQVMPWTVNASADMQRLLDWGVDGLITDYPDRLREVMQARGLPLPPALP